MPSNHTAPPKKRAQKNPAGPSGYREQYGVIVICEGEKHQARVYEDLRARGYACRVVVT